MNHPFLNEYQDFSSRLVSESSLLPSHPCLQKEKVFIQITYFYLDQVR